MKTFISTLLLSFLILGNPFINKSEANIFDIFKNPTEACMDLYIKNGGSDSAAARRCRNITKSEYTCFKKLISRGNKSPWGATEACRNFKFFQSLD